MAQSIDSFFVQWKVSFTHVGHASFIVDLFASRVFYSASAFFFFVAWIFLFFFTQTSCPTFDCYRRKHQELRRHTNTIIFIRKELQTRKGFVISQMVRDTYDDWYGSTLYELQSALGQIEKKKGESFVHNEQHVIYKGQKEIQYLPYTKHMYGIRCYKLCLTITH
ncbi:uncharacterized protein LOC126627508 isoform X2 [Malus sylvestris]|uniref:uncharacterized protein LOC126627508 isoform X2 n=1 Tax=Malus sylvestris TaxID=3752 RepID=UPI0021AC6E16|nr:uncharacterized protein LOC126627508 isoform X2 [Malus sylvestris]XP_050153044.1 uncharacterized protein LOC126627508 isoform X2 [Malus sylvestris]